MYFIPDEKTWARCLDYMGLKPGGGANGKASLNIHSKTGDKVILVGVFDGELSTLVHECGHVAFWILDHVGVKLADGEGNEAYCYLLQTLVDLFLPHLKEKQ